MTRKALITKISPALAIKTAVVLGDDLEKESIKVKSLVKYNYQSFNLGSVSICV